MTDQPKKPATDQPPAEPVKDAVPAGSFAKPPLAKKLTFSQQLFIWTMIVIVGLLFGVGASASIITQEPEAISGVSETEITPRMRVAERLEKILNPNGGGYYQPMFALQRRRDGQGKELDVRKDYAENLSMARIAEARGLMPKGKALDRIEAAFLGTPLNESKSRTYRDALVEHEGGADEVRREDLRLFLQERSALDGLQIRAAIGPAIPRSLGDELASARRDQVDLVEVVLSGSHLIPTIAADDPEIATTYERLRASRFLRPASVGVSLALADRDALGKAIEVNEADAKLWYDAHQDRFQAAKDPANPDKPAAVKPFASVKDEAIGLLRAERGTAKAQALANKLDEREELDGEKDHAKFAKAAAEAGLEVRELKLDDKTPGTIDLGALGTVKDVMRVFGREHEPGFTSRAMQTSAGHWVVIHLVSRTEPGFQDLAVVRDEVVRHLAGRRAYGKLLTEAGRLRDSLKGPGALAAWAASEAAKPWKATISTTPTSLLDRLLVPATEADGTIVDTLLVAPLAMPDRQVALAATRQTWVGDVPQVRLVQAGELKPGKGEEADRPVVADGFRRLLARYSVAVFLNELRQQEKR